MTLLSLSTAQKTLILAVFIGFGCIGISFISHLPLGDASLNFTGKKDRERLGNEKPVAQIFTPHQNGLSSIKYHLGNLHLLPGERLLFELRDAECQNVIKEATARPIIWTSPIYTRFDFARIPDSQGKTYCAVILYESPYDRSSDSRPFINTSEKEGSRYTLLDKQKTQENETLHLRPAYSSGSVTKDLWSLTERMSQYKPDIIKGLPLLILVSLVFLGSLLLSLWIIFAKEKEEGRSK